MKDLETVQDVLASARAGLDPSPVARARVRKRVLQRAATLGAIGTAAAVKSAAAGTVAGGSGAAALGASHSLVALTKVFVSSFVLSAVGATTVVVGIEGVTGSAEANAPSNTTELRTRAPEAGNARHSRDASTTRTTEHVVEQPEPEHRAPEPPAPPRAAENRGAMSAQRAPGAAPPRADLEGELSLLRGAREAISSGRTQQARHLLAQLDQRYPAGLLVEERSALRAVADCPTAADAVRARLGNQFLTAYPRSVYAARVQLACRTVADPTAVPASSAAESQEPLTERPSRGH